MLPAGLPAEVPGGAIELSERRVSQTQENLFSVLGSPSIYVQSTESTVVFINYFEASAAGDVITCPLRTISSFLCRWFAFCLQHFCTACRLNAMKTARRKGESGRATSLPSEWAWWLSGIADRVRFGVVKATGKVHVTPRSILEVQPVNSVLCTSRCRYTRTCLSVRCLHTLSFACVGIQVLVTTWTSCCPLILWFGDQYSSGTGSNGDRWRGGFICFQDTVAPSCILHPAISLITR